MTFQVEEIKLKRVPYAQSHNGYLPRLLDSTEAIWLKSTSIELVSCKFRR